MDVHCKCGETLKRDYKFCPSCGKEFEAKGKCKCSNCDNDLENGQKFCPQCGHGSSTREKDVTASIDVNINYVDKYDQLREHDHVHVHEKNGNVNGMHMHGDTDTSSPQKLKYSLQSMMAIRTHEKNKGSPKATKAQKYFSEILRQAAQVARLWDTAPHFAEITGKQWDKFWTQLLTSCPELKNEKCAVKERLLEKLENRRGYLKKKKGKKEKSSLPMQSNPTKEKSSIKSPFPLQSTCTSVTTMNSPSNNSEGGLCNGDSVMIMKGEQTLGSGIIAKLNIQNDPLGLYCEVVLHKKRPVIQFSSEEINLPKETEDGITVFQELNEKSKFIWRKSNLLKNVKNTNEKKQSNMTKLKSTCKEAAATSTGAASLNSGRKQSNKHETELNSTCKEAAATSTSAVSLNSGKKQSNKHETELNRTCKEAAATSTSAASLNSGKKQSKKHEAELNSTCKEAAATSTSAAYLNRNINATTDTRVPKKNSKKEINNRCETKLDNICKEAATSISASSLTGNAGNATIDTGPKRQANKRWFYKIVTDHESEEDSSTHQLQGPRKKIRSRLLDIYESY